MHFQLVSLSASQSPAPSSPASNATAADPESSSPLVPPSTGALTSRNRRRYQKDDDDRDRERLAYRWKEAGFTQCSESCLGGEFYRVEYYVPRTQN